jgi:hypothetical protein
MPQLVGHVAAITRYPVKSMAGEPCETADIDWHGIKGDRQYAFLKRDDATRFPWFTGRDLSELVRHRALYDDPADPRRSSVTVTAPDGDSWPIAAPELHAGLEAASGRPLHLMQLGRGAYDAMPLSLVSTASLAALEAAHGGVVEARRFRANIVVESTRREDDWDGREVRFGTDGPALLLAVGAPRCAMVTIDPDTAARDPRVLRTVAQAFGNRFTTYASVARTGTVQVGDPVLVG